MPWGRLFICSGLHDSRPVAPSANSLTMRIPRGSREPRIQIGDWKLRSTLSAIAFLALSAASFGQQPANVPYLDPTLSPEKRAADLVSRMTLEEKVLQMQNSGLHLHALRRHVPGDVRADGGARGHAEERAGRGVRLIRRGSRARQPRRPRHLFTPAPCRPRALDVSARRAAGHARARG